MGTTLAGGCQCGAVRYRAARVQDDAHVCHCRMCQKAVGNLFVGLVGVALADFAWTRGEPAVFYSSEKVARGFCGNCGTPLFYRDDGGDSISMTIGSLDEPGRVALVFESGMEGRLAQIDQIDHVENRGALEDDVPDWAAEVKAGNRQHPDHDTDDWPAG